MGSPATPSPYSQTTLISDLPEWKKQLLGMSANAPYYSPYKVMARQSSNLAKMYEGLTTNPTWSSMYQYYGVPQGTDLTPYIQATRSGTMLPTAPIAASPEAGSIPEYTAPGKKGKAQGGLMSLRKYAAGGLTSAQRGKANSILSLIANGKDVSTAQKDWLNNLETKSGINLSPYTNTGTAAIPSQYKGLTTTAANAANRTTPVVSAASASPGTALYGGEAAARADTKYGGLLNPIYQQALDQLRTASQAPETIGQGAGVMSQAAQDLMAQAGFSPQQIAAQNVAAPTATASSYDAAQMASPQNIAAQGYEAAQMQGAQMGGAGDVYANTLAQQQMDRGQIQNVQAQKAQAALMSGPESWAQPGVAQAYMNPYVKTALASQQELANIDLQKQLNQIMGQAAGQGAFGGSRTQQALMESRRNQDLANRNMAAQALSQAYTQGMGQFTGEQQMAQSAKSANQAAVNAANLNYVAQQLAAQQANQGMDYNTALQNMQAKLGVQQAQQAADLQASLANQQYGQTGFQTQAQNLASRNQAAAANMQAINSQRSQYVTQALQAAQANQQAQLTTEQQNMIARNAASQFNAQNATQISQANAQMNLAGQQSNQQANLAAATQNQQAGLTGQGLNLQALNQAGQMGQGLGALGVSTWNAQQNIPQLWGAAGQTVQNIAQGAADRAANTAATIWGGATASQTPVFNAVTGQQATVGQQNVNTLPH